MLDDQTYAQPTPAPSGLARLARHADMLTGAVAAVILIAGGAVVLSGLDDRLARLEAAVRETPPIAVIDYAPVLDGLAAGAPREALETAFNGVKALAKSRVDAGYIVINASFVEGAPERFRLSVPPDAERELRAAIAASRAMAGADGGFSTPSLPAPGAQPMARDGAGGLGAAMTPAEARALLGGALGGAGQ